MIIIVKNIKSGIKIENIVAFIKPAIKSGFFFKNEELHSIKIIELFDHSNQTYERHGLIRIANDAEKNVINRLKHRVKGKEQKIDEYIIRQWRNDRRTLLVSESLAHSNDRRIVDRRRKQLVLTITESVNILDDEAKLQYGRFVNPDSGCCWKIVPQRRAQL